PQARGIPDQVIDGRRPSTKNAGIRRRFFWSSPIEGGLPIASFVRILLREDSPIASFVRISPFALSVGAQRRSRSSAPFDSAACGRYAQDERTTYGFTQAAGGRYAQGKRTTYGFTQAACGRYAQG